MDRMKHNSGQIDIDARCRCSVCFVTKSGSYDGAVQRRTSESD